MLTREKREEAARGAAFGSIVLGFLVKSLVCIALVLVALHWRDDGKPPADSRARVAAPKPPRRPQIEEAAQGLAQAGADALVSAARDRCLAAPRDCAAALQRLQGAGR